MNLCRFSAAPAALLVLLLASAAGAQTPPAPQPAWMSYATPLVPTVPTPEHLQAAGALADALGLQEVLLAELRSYHDASPAQRDFDARFLAQFGHDEMLRRASEAYARLFTLEEARALAAALRSPAAGRALRYLHQASVPGADPATREVLRDLERTSEGKKLLASGSAIQQANADLLFIWRRNYADQLAMPSFRAMVAPYRARIAGNDASEPVLFVPPPIGIAYIDATVAASAQRLYLAAHGTWLLNHDIAALGIRNMITPQVLTDAAGLPQRRAALDKAEPSIKRFLAEAQANETAYLNALEKIDMPFRDQEMRTARKQASEQLQGTAQSAESLLAELDQMRRMLAFAESRKGKLQVHGSELVFADDADRLYYDDLMEEARRESGRYYRRQDEAVRRLDKLMEKINP